MFFKVCDFSYKGARIDDLEVLLQIRETKSNISFSDSL